MSLECILDNKGSCRPNIPHRINYTNNATSCRKHQHSLFSALVEGQLARSPSLSDFNNQHIPRIPCQNAVFHPMMAYPARAAGVCPPRKSAILGLSKNSAILAWAAIQASTKPRSGSGRESRIFKHNTQREMLDRKSSAGTKNPKTNRHSSTKTSWQVFSKSSKMTPRTSR